MTTDATPWFIRMLAGDRLDAAQRRRLAEGIADEARRRGLHYVVPPMALIGWALHREGALPDWMRTQLEAVLAHRHRPGAQLRMLDEIVRWSAARRRMNIW